MGHIEWFTLHGGRRRQWIRSVPWIPRGHRTPTKSLEHAVANARWLLLHAMWGSPVSRSPHSMGSLQAVCRKPSMASPKAVGSPLSIHSQAMGSPQAMRSPKDVEPPKPPSSWNKQISCFTLAAETDPLAPLARISTEFGRCQNEFGQVEAGSGRIVPSLPRPRPYEGVQSHLSFPTSGKPSMLGNQSKRPVLRRPTISMSAHAHPSCDCPRNRNPTKCSSSFRSAMRAKRGAGPASVTNTS